MDIGDTGMAWFLRYWEAGINIAYDGSVFISNIFNILTSSSGSVIPEPQVNWPPSVDSPVPPTVNVLCKNRRSTACSIRWSTPTEHMRKASPQLCEDRSSRSASGSSVQT